MEKSIYGLEWTLLYVCMFENRNNRQHLMEADHVKHKRTYQQRPLTYSSIKIRPRVLPLSAQNPYCLRKSVMDIKCALFFLAKFV